MVASTQWFVSFLEEQGTQIDVPPLLVGAAVASLGLLMVSPIPYRSFKELDLRHGFRTIVLVILVLALIVQKPSVTFFVIGVAYVSAGPIEWVWRMLTGRSLTRDASGGALSPDPQQESGA